MASENETSHRRTLAEVAERVGVSARTVSRVVNDEGGFSPETRARVLAAIREVGYRPNLAARALVTNTTHIVGLMVTYITDPYFPALAESVAAHLAKSGRTMIVSSNHDDVSEQRQVLDAMISHGVDGIIAAAARGESSHLREAADLGIPIVAVDVDIHHPRVGVVANDVAAGAVLAARHLLQRGHRRIAMVTTERSSNHRSRREDAFVGELADHGIDAIRVSVGRRPTIEVGAFAAEELLAEYPDTTAVFGYNDMMAVGVMRYAEASGRTIPDDLAVIGFDDIDIAEIVTPALSTIRIDRGEFGRCAAEMLSGMIGQAVHTPQPSIIPTELVIRRST